MGVPVLEPARIPFRAEVRDTRYAIDLDGKEYQIGAVSMGNPHAVLNVDSTEAADVSGLGPRLENHPRFPRPKSVCVTTCPKGYQRQTGRVCFSRHWHNPALRSSFLRLIWTA